MRQLQESSERRMDHLAVLLGDCVDLCFGSFLQDFDEDKPWLLQNQLPKLHLTPRERGLCNKAVTQPCAHQMQLRVQLQALQSLESRSVHVPPACAGLWPPTPRMLAAWHAVADSRFSRGSGTWHELQSALMPYEPPKREAQHMEGVPHLMTYS